MHASSPTLHSSNNNEVGQHNLSFVTGPSCSSLAKQLHFVDYHIVRKILDVKTLFLG
jgi:hypothetical protein